MFYNNLKKYTGFYLSVKCAVESMIDKKLSEGLSKWFSIIKKYWI